MEETGRTNCDAAQAGPASDDGACPARAGLPPGVLVKQPALPGVFCGGAWPPGDGRTRVQLLTWETDTLYIYVIYYNRL